MEKWKPLRAFHFSTPRRRISGLRDKRATLTPHWYKTSGNPPARYRHNGPVVLNDLNVTPGQIDPTHDRAFLCSSEFRTGSIRNVTQSTKWKICDEYGIPRKECNKANVEIDHLIPLEDGGTNDISNAATFGDHRWVCKISSTPKA